MEIQITQAKRSEEDSSNCIDECLMQNICKHNNIIEDACICDLPINYYPTDFIITD